MLLHGGRFENYQVSRGRAVRCVTISQQLLWIAASILFRPQGVVPACLACLMSFGTLNS
jgi:hypothetical protein